MDVMLIASSENPRESLQQEVLMRRRNYSVWIILSCFLLLQYALFRQYAVREVTWAHPGMADQTGYLIHSYRAFENLLAQGFVPGVLENLRARSSHGVMLPVQSSILFLLLGPNRLAALTLSFLYFALSELVLFYTVRWLTRSWALAFIAISLLLLSASRFFWAGGLYDFRLDSIAASLYTIMLCLAIRSRFFISLPFSIAYGAAGALLILFRFVAVSYVVFTLLAVIAVLLVFYTRDRSSLETRQRFRHALIALGIVTLLTGPSLFQSRAVLLTYYGRHLGFESGLRAAQAGVHTQAQALLFYPKSLLNDHLGGAYALGVLLFFGMRMASGGKSSLLNETRSYVFLAAVAILVPLLLFTIDQSKSAVVASLVVGPLTLLIILLGASRDGRLILAGAGVLVAMAVAHEFSAASNHSFFGQHRAEENQLLDTYDVMAKYAADAGWSTPKVASDRIVDDLNPFVYSVLTYERTGVLPPSPAAGMPLHRIPHDEALSLLDAADFVFLTVMPSSATQLIYPLDQQMAEMESELWARVSKDHLRFRTLSYAGRDVALFVKPAIKLGRVSGGWITSDGVSLETPCSLVRYKSTFVIGGKTLGLELLGDKLNAKATFRAGGSERNIPATVSLAPAERSYSVSVDLRNIEISAGGACEIDVAFDRYFIPRERGINDDPRKLVVQAPTEFRFE